MPVIIPTGYIALLSQPSPRLATKSPGCGHRPGLFNQTEWPLVRLLVYWKYSFTFSKNPFSFLPGCGVKLSDSRSFSSSSRSWLLTFLGVHTFR